MLNQTESIGIGVIVAVVLLLVLGFLTYWKVKKIYFKSLYIATIPYLLSSLIILQASRDSVLRLLDRVKVSPTGGSRGYNDPNLVRSHQFKTRATLSQLNINHQRNASDDKTENSLSAIMNM